MTLTDDKLVAAFDRFWSNLRTVGLVLAVGAALLLGVVAIVVAAHAGGGWGVFLLAIFVGCMVVGITDARASRRRSRRWSRWL